jgi:hypothetical protein
MVHPKYSESNIRRLVMLPIAMESPKLTFQKFRLKNQNFWREKKHQLQLLSEYSVL